MQPKRVTGRDLRGASLVDSPVKAQFEIRRGGAGSFREKGHWRHVPEAFVRPFRVVTVPPFFADGAHFCERGEDPGIEDFLPEAAVEPLGVGVLVRHTGFDIGERDAVGFAPRT